MRIKQTLPLITISLLLGSACAAPGAGPTPEVSPTNEATGAAGGVDRKPRGPWSFSYALGTYTYNITTKAVVAQFPDTTTGRSLPATVQEATVTVTDTGVAVVDPPVPSSLKCNERAALFARAQVLLPKLPSELSAGATWNDSTTTSGCRGSVPTTTTLVRIFTVVGDTTFGNTPALHIKRAERIIAKGEGNEGQHRILVSATGQGTADIFVDVTSGRFLGLDGVQTTQVGITASGRKTDFLQKVSERIVLAPRAKTTRGSAEPTQ